MMTLHAGGGPRCCAPPHAAADSADPPLLVAVTVLTSLDDAISPRSASPVPRSTGAPAGRARPGRGLARRGLLALEIAQLRRDCGPDSALVVPGIRPTGQRPAIRSG